MPGGHSSFFGLLNTAVHIVMYSYYMLAAMGPKVQKYLWWKKYLTVFQMVQFIAVMVHAFQLLFSNPCNYPMSFVWWIGLHACMFLFLFKNFYDQAYKKVCSKNILICSSVHSTSSRIFLEEGRAEAKSRSIGRGAQQQPFKGWQHCFVRVNGQTRRQLRAAKPSFCWIQKLSSFSC